jgi:membrane protease YdiL (CAAX protease family)
MKSLKFFLLVFALAIPFYLVGALTTFQLLPGVPLSGLGVLCPVGAAVILVYGRKGIVGVTDLLKRSFDFKRVKSKVWYVPLILLMPCIMVISYVVMRLTGVSLPTPQFSVLKTLILFAVFIIPALCEELGWSGYAIGPLQYRFGALQASILVGVVWAIWHFIPLLEVHRSWVFIAWWSLATVAARVIIVWLYNNTGKSVFVATVFHTMMNVTWQLFPVNGSYYDPRITGLIMAFVAAIVAIVWGARTLARYRTA